MLWSLMPFGSGKVVDLGIFPRIPPALGGNAAPRFAAHLASTIVTSFFSGEHRNEDVLQRRLDGANTPHFEP